MNIEDEIEELYERWLMAEYPDEIRNKAELIDKSSEGLHRDEFNEVVKKNL